MIKNNQEVLIMLPRPVTLSCQFALSYCKVTKPRHTPASLRKKAGVLSHHKGNASNLSLLVFSRVHS